MLMQLLSPFDTPVLVFNVQPTVGKAGTTGRLKSSLQAVADQTKPYVIVVRVKEGEAEARPPVRLSAPPLPRVNTPA